MKTSNTPNTHSIQVLPQKVVDQIAAGEVVEQPSHLIKELVENSIDAGATEVEIQFDHGGRSVQVQDNGYGISKKDLPLCLSRHATSKIKSSSDLWTLSSFGFRGEALASIASVSQLEISSQKEGNDQAYKLSSHFGDLSEVSQTGLRSGSSVHITKLFENTPARLKFLKSEAVEHGRIKNVIKALALAHKHIQIRTKHKGRLLYFWPAAKTDLERVKQVLNQDQIFFSEYKLESINVRAVFSSPNNTLKNNKQIWLFAQNRWIQDRSLYAAVMQAYRSLLMHGEYPIVTLFVELPNGDIDVNIHPAKSQVKFRLSPQIFKATVQCLEQGLRKSPWLEELLGPQQNNSLQSSHKDSSLIKNFQSQKDMRSFSQQGPQTSFLEKQIHRTHFNKKADSLTNEKNPSIEDLKNAANVSNIHFSVGANSSAQTDLENKTAPITYEQETATSLKQRTAHSDKQRNWAQLQVLGQANLTYIITQSDHSLIFIDQHAAHERVAYERLMKNFKEGLIEVQSFLIPETISLSPELIEAILPKKDELEKMGLHFDSIGPESLAVRAAPQLIKPSSFQPTFEVMGQEIVSLGGSFALEKVISHIFATMACHSVVRAGDVLNPQQMHSLLLQMDEFSMSSFCPHGRPVFVEYPYVSLEKDFGRTN